VLEAEHPRLALEFLSQRGAEAKGVVELECPDGTLEEIRVRIVFPPDHPAVGPVAFDAAKRWTPALERHILGDHSFCLYLEGVQAPDVATTAGLAGWLRDLVLFLQQQLIFDATGRFPGPEWAHGRAAYAQHLIDLLDDVPLERRHTFLDAVWDGKAERNWPCPCGSTRKVKRCHLDQIAEIKRVALRGGFSRARYEQLQEALNGRTAREAA
jgi:hypothetical protein